MKRTDRDAAGAVLACDVSGQLPHPHKVRLTLANVAVMLPVELLVHAAVVNTEMPYFQKVLVLTVTATVLVIWVAEPSVRRALRDWLHAPALNHRRRLHVSPTLWRVRTLVDDEPGDLGKLARSLAGEKRTSSAFSSIRSPAGSWPSFLSPRLSPPPTPASWLLPRQEVAEMPGHGLRLLWHWPTDRRKP
jgi:hypothetical protein